MITKSELEKRLRYYGNIVIVVKNTKIQDADFLKNKCYLGWKPKLKIWTTPTMSPNDNPAIEKIRRTYDQIVEYNGKCSKNLDFDLLTSDEYDRMRYGR